MPEEQPFNGLPNEDDPKADPKADAPKVETPEDKKRREDTLRNLTIAAKKEDERLAKLREDLNKKRQEAKKLEKSLTSDEPDEEEEPEPAEQVPEDKITQTVEGVLKKKEDERLQQELISQVRGVAKTKQEAEQIFEEAKKFPSDWSVSDRVAFAKQRVQTLRERTRGFVSPSPTAAGGFEDLDTHGGEEVQGMTRERVEGLKKLGWTVDEIKKFKDGPDLGRVWGDGKVLVNNKGL